MCNILQHQKMLQEKFDHYFSNLIQHHRTSCNMLLQGGQTCVTRVARCCVEMLHAFGQAFMLISIIKCSGSCSGEFGS